MAMVTNPQLKFLRKYWAYKKATGDGILFKFLAALTLQVSRTSTIFGFHLVTNLTPLLIICGIHILNVFRAQC